MPALERHRQVRVEHLAVDLLVQPELQELHLAGALDRPFGFDQLSVRLLA